MDSRKIGLSSFLNKRSEYYLKCYICGHEDSRDFVLPSITEQKYAANYFESNGWIRAMSKKRGFQEIICCHCVGKDDWEKVE